MFVVVVGGGKVGSNVARTLLANGHEVVARRAGPRALRRARHELGHGAVHGDATELYVLELAGIRRPPDIVVAVTGDDEDNIVICQLARERYGVAKA